ncbi:unnamed protein product [Meganyctiphanes norvegica]|uniref:Uncharacterized protein n=1 Tax=Meganyctiphanes norvegica TaxID=48144 RepID=A0AAV2QFE0_MEGNR
MKTLILMMQMLVSLGGVVGYNDNNVQYHIQTDKGPDRYFRFQTYNGQYRKEKRREDGTVIGTYGWVDPTGLLRLFDYIADKQGYRIVRQQTIQKPIPTAPPTPVTSAPLPGRQRRPLSRPRTTTYATTTDITTTTVAATAAPPRSQQTLLSTADANKYKRGNHRPLPVTSAPLPGRRRRPLSRHRTTTYATTTDITTVAVTAAPPPSQQTLLSTADANKYKRRNHRPLPVRQTVRRRPVQRRPVAATQLSSSTRRRVPAVVPGADSKSKSSSGSPVNDLLRTTAVDEVVGRSVIDFDLGNQFRKEKLLPDGTKVGRHGYVDPLGILRVTYYASGPSGHDERQESRWVGTRTHGQLL